MFKYGSSLGCRTQTLRIWDTNILFGLKRKTPLKTQILFKLLPQFLALFLLGKSFQNIQYFGHIFYLSAQFLFCWKLSMIVAHAAMNCLTTAGPPAEKRLVGRSRGRVTSSGCSHAPGWQSPLHTWALRHSPLLLGHRPVQQAAVQNQDSVKPKRKPGRQHMW